MGSFFFSAPRSPCLRANASAGKPEGEDSKLVRALYLMYMHFLMPDA